MKTIKRLSVIICSLIFSSTVNGQYYKNSWQNDDNVEEKIWANAGITQIGIFSQTRCLSGINFQTKKNHVFGLGYYNYGGTHTGLFRDPIPNILVESITLNISYGYCLDFNSGFFKLIPSLGLGRTSGTWRTNDLIPSFGGGSFMGGGSWFSSGSNYIEIPFSGISISPQIDFIFHTSWGGIGLILTHNTTFVNGNNYSSNDFAFHVCLGKMR